MSRSRKNKPSGPAPASPNPRTRELIAGWTIVIIALCALHLTNVSSELGGNLGGDNAIYYLLARAIATGQGYVDLYLPGHPAQVKFPFLFPLLLAPFPLLFRNPFPAMHTMVALLNVTACALLGMWAGKRLGSAWKGLALAVVFGTTPKVFQQSAHLLSEPVYMALCYLALLIMPEARNEAASTRRFTALTFTVIAAYFTRTAGLALAAAAAATLLIHRSSVAIHGRRLPSAWALAGLFIAVAGAWMVRNLAASGSGMVYLIEFAKGDPTQGFGASGLGNLIPHALHNASMYLPYLGDIALTPAMYAPLPRTVLLAAGYALAAVIATGVALEFRDRHFMAGLFTILSILMAVFWPFREDRFVLPVVPLCVYFLFRAVDHGARIVAPRAAGWIFTALCGVVLLANGWVTGNSAAWRFARAAEPHVPVAVEGYGHWTTPVINWANYDINSSNLDPAAVDQLMDYIIINLVAVEKTDKTSVIMSRKPMLTYLYSGRESVPLLYDPLPEKQWEYMQRNKVDYIVTGLAEDELRAVMERWPKRFQTVAQIAPGRVRLIKVLDTDIP